MTRRPPAPPTRTPALVSKIVTVTFRSDAARDAVVDILRQHGTTSGPEISVSCFDDKGQPARLLVSPEGSRGLTLHAVGE